MQPIITVQDMNFLSMPITRNDPAAQVTEALRVSQLNAQLHLQQRTLEATEQDARW